MTTVTITITRLDGEDDSNESAGWVVSDDGGDFDDEYYYVGDEGEMAAHNEAETDAEQRRLLYASDPNDRYTVNVVRR